ncbi:hypothetical protein JCM8202v2_002215 [Rhodotorula sphaerocarpa]
MAASPAPQVSQSLHRAYQWTQGFDITVAHQTRDAIRLVCATHVTCPFNIAAEYTIFTEPPVQGQAGYRLDPSPTAFQPQHDHAAPYVPLDVEAENRRRAQLSHDDPSLDKPPLVPLTGFAGSDTSDPEPTATTPMMPTSTAAAVAAAAPLGGRDTPRPRPDRTALEAFLLQIHSGFDDYFSYFGDTIPLSMSVSELVELDSTTSTDSPSAADLTVFNMFLDVPELPRFLAGAAADGVRRAKLRREQQPDNVSAGYNPKLAVGFEKAKLDKWARQARVAGQAKLAGQV